MGDLRISYPCTETHLKKGDIKFQTLFRGDERERENQLMTQHSRRQFSISDTIHLLPGRCEPVPLLPERYSRELHQFCYH